jgi:hypothetical protein
VPHLSPPLQPPQAVLPLLQCTVESAALDVSMQLRRMRRPCHRRAHHPIAKKWLHQGLQLTRRQRPFSA